MLVVPDAKVGVPVAHPAAHLSPVPGALFYSLLMAQAG